MPSISATNGYLTLAQLCEATGFGSTTIHRWKKRGLIPFFQPGGKHGHLRFPMDAIEHCRQVGNPPAAAISPTSDTSSKLPGRPPQWTVAHGAQSPS